MWRSCSACTADGPAADPRGEARGSSRQDRALRSRAPRSTSSSRASGADRSRPASRSSRRARSRPAGPARAGLRRRHIRTTSAQSSGWIISSPASPGQAAIGVSTKPGRARSRGRRRRRARRSASA